LVRGFSELLGLWNYPTEYELPSKEAVLFPSQVMFERNLVYTRHVGIGLFADVCPKTKLLPLFPIAMASLVTDMQVVINPPERSFKPASIHVLYSRMSMFMLGLATVNKGLEVG